MARPRRQHSEKSSDFICPECGREFGRAAALGAHRRRAHGVIGATSRARGSGGQGRNRRTGRAGPAPSEKRASTTTSKRSGTDAALDRDALLKAVFPNGIPPSEEVVRSLNAWLDEAERLATKR